jgi:predicted transglutaminase-like cysteine proteinase
VTNRHELLLVGWAPSTLLLAEVLTANREHHLVLIIRAETGDFVADSLTDSILPWHMAGYQWIRLQSPQNPALWQAVRAAH